jgi:hypothetical protein
VKLKNLRYLAAALVVTGMAVALTPEPADAELIGLVKQVKADAFGTPPGAEREGKLPRFPVVHNELLETGEGSAMLVEFLDKTLLTLGAGANLTVDTFVYDPKTKQGTSVFNLTVGVLRFISGNMVDDKVSIVTPTAVIGIRGSDALITVALDGSTAVNVFSGRFSVSNSDGTEQTSVGPAQTASVSSAGTVSPVAAGTSNPPNTPQAGSSPGKGDDPGRGEDKEDRGSGDEGDRDDDGDRDRDDDGHHDDNGWTYYPTVPGPNPGSGPGPGKSIGGSPPDDDHPDDDHPDDHDDDDDHHDDDDDDHGDDGGDNGGNGH